MHIIDLYKLHINPQASMIDIHNFMSSFELSAAWVPHPDEDVRKNIAEERRKRTEIAKQHILKNSKLKLD